MRLWHLLSLLFILAFASFVLPQPSSARPVARVGDPFKSTPMWVIVEKRDRRGSRRNGGVPPTPLPLRNLRRHDVSSPHRLPEASAPKPMPASTGVPPTRGADDVYQSSGSDASRGVLVKPARPRSTRPGR